MLVIGVGLTLCQEVSVVRMSIRVESYLFFVGLVSYLNFVMWGIAVVFFCISFFVSQRIRKTAVNTVRTCLINSLF